MKFVRNTGRYAIAFTIVKNERNVKIELDRRRLFMDTGNIATTGITPVEEEDIEELKKQKRFCAMLESGELAILDESDVKTPEESKIAKLEEENRKLQEKLKKAGKDTSDEDEKAMKALADENACLKAQLESLTKAKAEAEAEKAEDEKAEDEKAEDEGF